MLRSFNRFSSIQKNVRFYSYFEKPEIRNNIALIRINGPEKMNVLNQNMFNEAKEIFDKHIFDNKELKSIVFISSKKDNFIAGADIEMLKKVKTRDEILNITKQGNDFFSKVKDLNIPLIAAIDGSCMGGGLEWALYCDYRIATNSPKTVFSLPEVKLGLMPGMGGTYNLPKLIGLPNSLDMILSGKNIRHDKAKKMGLIHEVVQPYELEQEALIRAFKLGNNKLKIRKRKKTPVDKLAEYSLVRNYIFSEAKKKVDKMTKGNMPAPYKILDTLKFNYNKDKKFYLDQESKSFADLIETQESKALIGLFTGSSEVKKHQFGKPNNISNVKILGAGLMGSGIAEVTSNKYPVFLKDNTQEGIELSKKKIRQDKQKNISFHYKDSDELLDSNFVIEAVFEDLKVKKSLLKNLEKNHSNEFIFASNTSAIPISKIAEDSKNPENIIGLHYFSPVPKMPLVEIIPHNGTSNSTISTAYDLAIKQNKTPILVKDVPGFFVNRCLAPLLVEIPQLILQGVNLKVLDEAMKEFGMPVGPLTLSDEVGIDISKHVSDLMSKSDLGIRMNGDTSLIDEMIKNNWLGRKTGKGFFTYKGKNKILNQDLLNLVNHKKINENITKEEIQMRLIGKYINEAAYCLQNEIIKSPVQGDIGSVFGIGFPPHLGGPFRMLDQLGLETYYKQMNELCNKYGEQFEPAPLLQDYYKSNKKFY